MPGAAVSTHGGIWKSLQKKENRRYRGDGGGGIRMKPEKHSQKSILATYTLRDLFGQNLIYCVNNHSASVHFLHMAYTEQLSMNLFQMVQLSSALQFFSQREDYIPVALSSILQPKLFPAFKVCLLLQNKGKISSY